MNLHTITQTVQEHATTALAATSGTAALSSYIMRALPYAQFTAAVIAGISGVFAIAVAVKTLRK